MRRLPATARQPACRRDSTGCRNTDAYFPGRRRHDLEAIVAYAAYGGTTSLNSRPSTSEPPGADKAERAALKYLGHYLEESDTSLVYVAQVAAMFVERSMLMRGV